jgi:hypothetical protein
MQPTWQWGAKAAGAFEVKATRNAIRRTLRRRPTLQERQADIELSQRKGYPVLSVLKIFLHNSPDSVVS